MAIHRSDMRKGFRIALTGLTLLSIALTAATLVSADEGRMRKVTFIAHWSPQAQFAGYYVAKEKGFYSERGLDVQILPSGPNISASLALDSGKADFAVLWLSQALQNRSKGINLINVAQIVQKTGVMFVSRKSAGINKPQDLDGKKASLWDGDLRLQGEVFINKYGLNVAKIHQSYTVNLFLAGGVDAVMAMWYNEYHTILNSGIDPDELSVFFFKDHGINVPEDGVYTLESNYRKDPALSKAFVGASIKGWLYAFEHPDEAVDIVLKRMRSDGIPANREHQKWMLKTIEQLMIADGDTSKMGILSSEDYVNVSGMLKESGLVDNIAEFNSFYFPVIKNAEK